MKEQIIKILNNYKRLEYHILEKDFDKIANDIEKLYQCKAILAKVKEAWTPDKRSFEEAEADKIKKYCPNCLHNIMPFKHCITCDDLYSEWEPKTE